ncbi:hypothetical protein [Burkholderia gladioli]|uniref:hypothetical protein n=1 Tax=Burkholderia gladioli TaxID=28095 RepID=UPI001C5FC337|nr:hypothetical protein [Burkholderia gladioli]MBW5284213.1 hypothetical protein [Burkholderia gladioli]
MRNDAWEARVKLIQDATNRICAKYPGANPQMVHGFVEAQFNAEDQTGTLTVTIDGLVRQYENGLQRQGNPDPSETELIEQVVYKCLVSKQRPNAELLPRELHAVYAKQVGRALTDRLPETNAVLSYLAERRFISLQPNVAGWPGIIGQGLYFDNWVRQMNKEDDNKPSITTHHNYHLTGTGNRVNVQSTDNSINTFASGGESIEKKIAELRQAIKDTNMSDAERQDALDNVDGIDQQFASGNPHKKSVKLLLDSLPKLGAIGTIASAIHAWLNK